mmetsp:Transcript_88545/g.176074  ORF Transcript_88545/g.176074 Transcript_88545/m.176074 type:complete len:228 (+) Transcript_88545:92-775(+)
MSQASFPSCTNSYLSLGCLPGCNSQHLHSTATFTLDRPRQNCSLALPPKGGGCPMLAEMVPRRLLDSKVRREALVADDAPSWLQWSPHQRPCHLKPVALALLSQTYSGQRRVCPLPGPHWVHAAPALSAKSCSSPALLIQSQPVVTRRATAFLHGWQVSRPSCWSQTSRPLPPPHPWHCDPPCPSARCQFQSAAQGPRHQQAQPGRIASARGPSAIQELVQPEEVVA